jgi:hypothetical protein
VVEYAHQTSGASSVCRDVLNLQHELAPVGGAQTKIAVPLSGQRANRDRQPVKVARDALALGNAERGLARPQS